MNKRVKVPSLKIAGKKVPRRGRPPKGTITGNGPLRFLVPDDVAARLRAIHGETFPEHRLQFGPWLAKTICEAHSIVLPPPGKPGPKGAGA